MSLNSLLLHRQQSGRAILLTYGAAVMAVFLITIIRGFLDPLLGNQAPYAVYYLAIAFAAWFGGFGPALVAIILSGIAGRFFFVAPRFGFSITNQGDLLAWVIFLAIGLITTLLNQSQLSTAHEAEARADEAREHLVKLHQEAKERMLAQKALAETQKRLQKLSESVPVMIWMTGPAGQFTYLNQQWFQYTGQNWGKMETRGWSQTIYQDDISRFMEVYTSAVKKLEEFRVDFRLITASGEPRWVMAQGVPHFSPKGAFEGYIGSAIDIEERKRDEIRNEFLLKFMSALSRALTPKEVADVIIGQGLLALDGHVGIVALVDKEEKYLNMVNRRGVPEELVELFKVLPIEANAPLCDCVRTGQPVWIETLEDYAKRYPTWSSEVLPLTQTQASACLPLKIGRDVIGAIQISFPRPITFTSDVRRFILTTAFQCAQAMERARLYEAEAAARKQAEIANALKLRFLGMVSHELRAPLHLIMGFSDMLVTPDMEWEPEKLDEIFGILNQESHKLHELVEQLLDASQVQAGTLGITMQEYPLSGVVEMARTQMEKFAENHELVIDVPDDLPIVKVDPARLGQVIVNLVSNAAKYSPAGTTITVSAFKNGNMVQIDVSDQGEGIPPEHRDSIFEAFQRIDRDRQKRIKGVGLGLAIVKGVIEEHEGRIWVQDRADPGTTMSFTVQIANQKENT